MSNNPNSFWKRFWPAFCGALAALIFNGIVMMMLFAAVVGIVASASDEDTVTVPHNAILTIDLSSPIGERTSDGSSDINPMFLLSGRGLTNTLGIYDAVKAINRAAEDNNIKMLLLKNGEYMAIPLSKLEEVRQAVAKFRESGKPVIAYGVDYSLGEYCLSSVADKIFMHKEGQGGFYGLGGVVLYYKDLLDKVGIEAQLIRHGKFKSAGEPFIRNDMSKENRLQQLEMMNSMWESLSDKICKSRGDIKLADLNKAIDNLELMEPEALLKQGLVDSLVDDASFSSYLCELTGAKSEKQLKYISLAKYSKTVTASSKAKDKIAILYADGEITMDGSSGVVAKRLIPQIKKIAADSSVKAVVFRVNSPGGEVTASELIRDEIQRLHANKPVISSYGEYAASGGYWISAESDAIVSDATTLTGSIGVYGLLMNGSKMFKQHLHVNPETLGTHAHSTMGSGMLMPLVGPVLYNPLDDAEKAYFTSSIEKTYAKFTSIVADGRKMAVAEVDSLGQGRVWTGAQGLKNGLVDKIGTLEDAIALAAEKAGLESYKVVEYPKVKSMMDNIMDMLSGSGEESTAAKLAKTKGLTDLTPEQIVSLLFPDLYNTKGSHIYARMPYVYEFKY